MDSKTKITLVASGVLSLMLGLAVLIGWMFSVSLLVRIYPSFTPMVIGTATCFMLGGFAVALSALQKPTFNYLIRISVIIIASISCLFLLEYIFGIDLFIDFREIHRPLSHLVKPGRMAMNTAIDFISFSIGMLILTYQPAFKTQRILCSISSFLALLVICIALLGLLGYLLHLEELYAWTSVYKMAIHTTLGMIFLGYGLWVMDFIPI